jgi:nicotinamidase-related amidase
MRPGLEGHALDPRLDVRTDDLIVDKYRYSAFIAGSSRLDELLRARGVDTVIVTGAFTNFCCESTARDGLMLGYRVVFVADATLARTQEEHLMALTALQLAFADVRTTAATAALIAASLTP